eukprot:5674866-Prymnesium_polylepis.1
MGTLGAEGGGTAVNRTPNSCESDGPRSERVCRAPIHGREAVALGLHDLLQHQHQCGVALPQQREVFGERQLGLVLGVLLLVLLVVVLVLGGVPPIADDGDEEVDQHIVAH